MASKKSVLIVYEDAADGYATLAKDIKKNAGSAAHVKVRSALDVSIPELLASDAYMLGVSDATSASWNELRRVLPGVNLAGRCVALFAPSTGRSKADALLSALEPTEARLSPEPCSSAEQGAAWIRSL